MRFHCVALPHTTLGPEHSACAFSMKVRHFIQMMKSLGHDCFHYGAEGSDIGPWCKEDVPIITTQEQLDFFGPHEPNSFYNVGFTGREPYWTLFNQRAAAEINKRKQRKDFVCIIMGTLQQSVAEQTEGDAQIVEYGIGYNGPLPRKAGRFRVYESYVHMHKLWGAEGGYDPNGYFYDAVIPNYFDPNDYPLQTEKGDYYLYIGRLVQRKGIHIAVETCKRLGVKLKIVGQGGRQEGNKIIANDGEVYEGDNLEYIGFANGAKRAALYQNAIATFVPTWYVEPFGGVAVESQMAGTPVLTTDFGAFAETVEHGRTGFRCRTLNDFIHGARAARELDPTYCNYRACKLYSMDTVRWQYQTFFNCLLDLWGEGWYACHERPDPRWLKAAI